MTRHLAVARAVAVAVASGTLAGATDIARVDERPRAPLAVRARVTRP